jgi:dipeptidyl aminopeptidase/acylaminoacyl peptidase
MRRQIAIGWRNVCCEENPIVLFLHGGPGTSQLSSNPRHTRDLEKHFIVVD